MKGYCVKCETMSEKEVYRAEGILRVKCLNCRDVEEFRLNDYVRMIDGLEK